MSRLHKSRSPTPLPWQLPATYILYPPPLDFLHQIFWKSFSFSQADVRGLGDWPLGELVQYAFNLLSSSLVRPNPDLLHGQAFFFGV